MTERYKHKRRLLLLVDFNPEKGGIARVGSLMYQQLRPDATLSFFGRKIKDKMVYGCNGNLALFVLKLFYHLVIKRSNEVYCDHLGKASSLIMFPDSCFSKLVIFLHDEEAWNRSSGRHYMALKKSTHLVCNSDYTYQRFIKTHPEFKDKTKTCLLAGVPSLFYGAEKPISKSKFHLWFSDHPRYCIFVSRLWKNHRYKGYVELIEAFARLYHIRPESKLNLVIIGRGNDEVFVRKLIKENLLQDRVFLFNDVNDVDLIHFYNRSEALVFPSSREGFGFVFLEAMYFKKPCIGLKNQPAEEIIEDGESGLLLQDNHPDTLLKVLLDLDLNPTKYTSMGEKGFEVYHEKFTVQHFQKRFELAVQP